MAVGVTKSRNGMRQHRRIAVGLLMFCLLCAPGCVRRRLTVRTTPPGAVVSVDNQVIGTAPAATSFVYYGTREIRVEKDGYQTEVLKRRLYAPWYQWPGIDFVTDTLWPFEIRDERIIDVELVPKQVEPLEQVMQRADQLRGQSRTGVVTAPLLPAASTSPPRESEELPSTGIPSGGMVFENAP